MERLKANIILLLLIPLMIITPDFIAKIFNNADQATLQLRFLAGIFLFGIFLSFSPRFFAFTILGFFILLELVQFGHLFYYNNLISSAKFALLFNEFDEVIETGLEAISFIYIFPFVVLIPYGILIFTFNKLEIKRFKTNFAIIPIIALLAVIPYRVNSVYNGIIYYPDPADHSLRNSLYSFTNYVLNIVNPSPRANVQYKDYQVESLASWQNEEPNIILIIGESLNPKHMSLFEYKLNTTPLLSSLKKDPNFTYLNGISSGVNTLVSVPLLLNGIYEPNNYQAIDKIPANLFKLAKQHNFKSFFISAQSGATMTNIGLEYVDHVIFRQKEILLFEKYQDEALLKIIPNLDYSEKNFIVLHQRNIHAPYESSYAGNNKISYFPVDKSDYRNFLRDTYDNAVKFDDYLIYNIIDFYRNKFKGPTYIFFTSDHSEGVGDDGIYGHSFLNEQIYKVPFISYIKNANPKIKTKEPICHYEIHNMIAGALGFKIVNPNLKPNTCYVQGTDLYGLNDFVEYTKSQKD